VEEQQGLTPPHSAFGLIRWGSRRQRERWTGRLRMMVTRMPRPASRRSPAVLSATTVGSFITPLRGKTTDWIAGCGRSAGPVWRQGGQVTASAFAYRRNPSTREVENLEVLFFSTRLQRSDLLELPATANLRLAAPRSQRNAEPPAQAPSAYAPVKSAARLLTLSRPPFCHVYLVPKYDTMSVVRRRCRAGSCLFVV
jgi:hypothetical protein